MLFFSCSEIKINPFFVKKRLYPAKGSFYRISLSRNDRLSARHSITFPLFLPPNLPPSLPPSSFLHPLLPLLHSPPPPLTLPFSIPPSFPLSGCRVFRRGRLNVYSSPILYSSRVSYVSIALQFRPLLLQHGQHLYEALCFLAVRPLPTSVVRHSSANQLST